MTATVAMQSVPSIAVQSAESSAKAASSKNNNETSKVENEQKSSFKNLYDDAKKVDNSAGSETKKHDVSDAAGKERLAEDGKSLPSEGKSTAAGNEKEASSDQQSTQLDEDSNQELLIAQKMASLNPDETSVK